MTGKRSVKARLADLLKPVKKELRSSGIPYNVDDWRPFGTVQNVVEFQQGVRCFCENGVIEIQPYGHDALFAQFGVASPLETLNSHRNFLSEDSVAPISLEIFESVSAVELRSHRFICRLDKNPFRIGIHTIDGRLITYGALDIKHGNEGRLRLSLTLLQDESNYGLACNFLELGGKRFAALENGVSSSQNTYEYQAPFFISVHGNGAYGLLWDDVNLTSIDVGATVSNRHFLESKGDTLAFYMFMGADARDVYTSFSRLVSHLHLPPRESIHTQFSSPNNIAHEATVHLTNDFRRFFEMTHQQNDHKTVAGVQLLRTSADMNWQGLQSDVVAMLSAGLSGITAIGYRMTIHVSRDPELFTRWVQTNCLMPILRFNSASNMSPQQFGGLDNPYERVCQAMFNLRQRLVPYLYSVVAQSVEYSLPVVRPIFIADQDDAALRKLSDCFLVGDALLVAPVLTSQTDIRMAHLPKGQWYDYWTHALYEGGREIFIPAPLERLPLFVRAGAVIPLWDDDSQGKNAEVNKLIYRVYAGTYETTLYEDAGDGGLHRDGDYRWIYFNTEQSGTALTIRRRNAGNYAPSDKQETVVEVVGLPIEPTIVRVDRRDAPLWFYDSSVLEVPVTNFQSIEITGQVSPTQKTLRKRLR